MEPERPINCPDHNKFQSFRCYTCNKYLCPTCLREHPHKKKVVRAEIVGYFFTYMDNSYDPQKSYNCTIWTYDVDKKALDFKEFASPRYNQEIILIQSMLYLSGGLTTTDEGRIAKAFNDFYVYDMKKIEPIAAKANMPICVSFNALCSTDDEAIYSVGGKNEKGYLSDCSKYVIANNTWKVLKPIPVARGNVSLGVYDCSIIYCVGGCNAKFSDLIESLDTSSDDNSWVSIKLADKEKFDPRNSMMIIQDPFSDTLMFFGGCSEIGINQDVFVFNPNDKVIKLSTMIILQKPSAFLHRKAALWDNNYYLFEYGRRAGIYKYSLRDMKIQRIKAKEYIGKDLWEMRIKYI